MKPRNRSLTGAAIAVVALPIFAGLTACLPTFPVPVGDPEKSSIDPLITGIWMLDDEESFWVFEPFDKRSWLLTAFEIDEDPESCDSAADDPESDPESDEAADENSYENTMAHMAALGTDCFSAERMPGAIKVWRTRFRGEWFMTWEAKGVFDVDTGFEPAEWYVWHIDTSHADELRLGMIDTDNDIWDPLEEIDEADITRRDVEKIFRKYADREGFYDPEAQLIFHRVLPEHLPLIADFINEGPLD